MGGGTGVVSLKGGISLPNLWFALNGSNLVISILGSTDSLTIQDWTLPNLNPVDTLQLPDGATLSVAEMTALAQADGGYQTANPGFVPQSATALPMANATDYAILSTGSGASTFDGQSVTVGGSGTIIAIGESITVTAPGTQTVIAAGDTASYDTFWLDAGSTLDETEPDTSALVQGSGIDVIAAAGDQISTVGTNDAVAFLNAGKLWVAGTDSSATGTGTGITAWALGTDETVTVIGNTDSAFGQGTNDALIENGSSCYLQLTGQYNAGTMGAYGTAYAWGLGSDTMTAGSYSEVFTPSPDDVISAAPGATGLHLELDSTGDIGYAVNPGNTIWAWGNSDTAVAASGDTIYLLGTADVGNAGTSVTGTNVQLGSSDDTANVLGGGNSIAVWGGTYDVINVATADAVEVHAVNGYDTVNAGSGDTVTTNGSYDTVVNTGSANVDTLANSGTLILGGSSNQASLGLGGWVSVTGANNSITAGSTVAGMIAGTGNLLIAQDAASVTLAGTHNTMTATMNGVLSTTGTSDVGTLGAFGTVTAGGSLNGVIVGSNGTVTAIGTGDTIWTGPSLDATIGGIGNTLWADIDADVTLAGSANRVAAYAGSTVTVTGSADIGGVAGVATLIMDGTLNALSTDSGGSTIANGTDDTVWAKPTVTAEIDGSGNTLWADTCATVTLGGTANRVSALAGSVVTVTGTNDVGGVESGATLVIGGTGNVLGSGSGSLVVNGTSDTASVDPSSTVTILGSRNTVAAASSIAADGSVVAPGSLLASVGGVDNFLNAGDNCTISVTGTNDLIVGGTIGNSVIGGAGANISLGGGMEVTAAGGTLSDSGTLVLNSGTQQLWVISGGTVAVSELNVAPVGTAGTFTVAGGLVSVTGRLLDGNGGAANAHIGTGGTLTAAAIVMAATARSNGNMGAYGGGRIEAQTVDVGNAGSSFLAFVSGGSLQAGTVDVGVLGGSTGTLNASDAGTALDASVLLVGDAGSGGMWLGNAASIAVAGSVVVGNQSAGSGDLELTTDGQLSAASMMIGNGGTGHFGVYSGAVADVAQGVVVGAAGGIYLQAGTVSAGSLTNGGQIGGTGIIQASSLLNSGGIKASGGLLTVSGPVGGDGLLGAQFGGTIEVSGVGGGQMVALFGTNEVLQVDDFATFDPVRINGLDATDRILVVTDSPTAADDSISSTYDSVNNLLSIMVGGTTEAFTLTAPTGSNLGTTVAGLDMVSASDTTVALGSGTHVVSFGALATGDTIVAPTASGAGAGFLDIFNAPTVDRLDFTSALTAAGWNGGTAAVGSFLQFTESGSAAVISVVPSGGAATAVMRLENTPSLTLSSFQARAIV